MDDLMIERAGRVLVISTVNDDCDGPDLMCVQNTGTVRVDIKAGGLSMGIELGEYAARALANQLIAAFTVHQTARG